MRILLLGCGAIGGPLAAGLCRAGHDLTLVTGNAQIRDAILADGLRVRELSGETTTARPVHEPVIDARQLLGQAPFDLCLLATKTTTLDGAARDVTPLLTEDAQVVCLQNGLPEDRVAQVVGSRRVIGCVVGWGASLLGPGMAARTSRGGFQLGRLPGARMPPDDPALRAVAAVLETAFPTKLAADLLSVRWSKLAINCATSTLGAAGGDTLGRLLRERFVRRLALELWGEVAAVARAEGVRMAKVAGTLDIESLALTAEERQMRVGSPSLLYKHSLLYLVGLKFRRMRSSMLLAIERGRQPEIDWLNGEVVRRGAAHGVPTPVNAGLVALIHDIVARRRTPGVLTLRAFHDGAQGAPAAAPRLLPAVPGPAGRDDQPRL